MWDGKSKGNDVPVFVVKQGDLDFHFYHQESIAGIY